MYRFSEIYGCMPGMVNTGVRQADSEIAETIMAHEKDLGIWKKNILRLCDPTCFNKKPDYRGGGQGASTAEVFAEYGINLTPGDPDRKLKIRQFHERLRCRFDKEGYLVERPMVQIYKTCEAFLRTIPVLQTDENNPEDVDTDAEDHVYDEACHAFMARKMGMKRKAQSARKDVSSWGR